MSIEIDMRKKGCPNTGCNMHQKKKKFDNKVQYCPECGSKTIYVCRRCFREIEDLGPDHRLCEYCVADSKAKLAKAGDAVKGAGGKVAGVALGAAGIAAAAAGKAGETELAKAAAKIGKEAVGAAVKVIKK